MNEQAGFWGMVGASLIAGFLFLRRYLRRDKEDGSASEVVVRLNTATQKVVRMLESRIDELVSELGNVRSELRKLISMHNDCEQQNLRLTSEVKALKSRVTDIEKAP